MEHSPGFSQPPCYETTGVDERKFAHTADERRDLQCRSASHEREIRLVMRTPQESTGRSLSMKSSQLLASLVLLTSVAQVSEAGLFDRVLCRKDSKRCDIGCDGCCPTVAPQCCKPVIVRPCGVTVHSYQRGCPTCKPA